MAAYVPYLADEDIAQAVSLSHGTWGGGSTLSKRVEAAKRVPHAGLRHGGELVCVLKRHPIELASDAGVLASLGISGVFTAAGHRGRGHAARLIRAVLDDARQAGAAAALLFSDIDPSFYARFGFEVRSAVSWQARRGALPPQTGCSFESCDDPARLLDLYRESWPPGWLRRHRTTASYAGRSAQLLVHGDRVIGYVIAERRDRTLWVDDLIAAQDADSHAWLAALAAARDVDRVAGWLRPEHAGGAFVATRRTHCVPMLAALDPHVDLGGRTHFAAIDHF